MNGTLVDTKLGLAVESHYLAEDGKTYVSRRLVNGCNGQPREGAVRWAGSNTWSGIGFTVATNSLPEQSLCEVIKPKPRKGKRP